MRRADQGGTVTLGRNASIDSLGAFATLLAETGTTLDLAGTVSALSGETVTLADSGGTLRVLAKTDLTCICSAPP